MEKDRLEILLYNAISLLEETYSKEEIQKELWITNKEYEKIMGE